MKKLAIIGGSNSFMKGGYGDLVREKLGDECDLYGIGGSTVSWPLSALLGCEIVDKYENVAIQLDPLDSINLNWVVNNKFYIISYMLGIAAQFVHSKSRLIFISMAYMSDGSNDEAYYIAKSICSILHITIIDLHEYYYFVSKDKLLAGNCHYAWQYSNFLANKILSTINVYVDNCELKVPQNINFELYKPKNTGLISTDKGTSHLKRHVYRLKETDTLYLPQDKYLCAVTFWVDKRPPFMIYQNNYIRLCKQMDYNSLTHLFLCQDIGYSCYSGLRGGTLTCSLNRKDCFFEPNGGSQLRLVPEDREIYLESLLLCNVSPIEYGLLFFQQYYAVFQECYRLCSSRIVSRWHFPEAALQNRVEELMPGHVEPFLEAIMERPDLEPDISSRDNPAEKLIIWAWRHGMDESANIRALEHQLACAITRLVQEQHYFQGGHQIPLLLYVIHASRPDLQKYDLATSEGRSALVNWFVDCGMREYRLEELIHIAKC